MQRMNGDPNPLLAAAIDVVAPLRGALHVPKMSILSDYGAANKRTNVTAQDEGRFARAGRFLQKHHARLGYVTATLILSAIGLVTSALTFSGIVRIILLAVIVLIAASAFYLFIRSIHAEDERNTNIEDLEKEVQQLTSQRSDLEDTVASFQEQYTALFAGLLSILANQVLGYGPTERVSVYRHDDHKKGFRMVSRYSDSHEFGKPSERTFYPDDEGAIGKAWQEARTIVAELPDPKEDMNSYLKSSEQDWRIKKEVVEKFKMKSCCYAAFPLQHPHGGEYGNIAVVVFESTEKNSLQVEKLREEMNGAEGERIAKFLVTMEAIEPRADIASEEGV